MRMITVRQLEERIERRKAIWGLSGKDYVLSNSGARRTQAKRDLLRALALNAARQGRRPAFDAKD